MVDTLVIIINQTRAHEQTFTKFKRNVLKVLNADLCVCIGVTPDYDYNNPFYKEAKHRFLYEEPADADYDSAFEYAYKEILKYNPSIKPVDWRSYFKLPFLGWGVKDSNTWAPISSGLQIFYRWFLLKNLRKAKLLKSYKRFIITRSDFIFNIPHPHMTVLDERFIWLPNGENYCGCVDRHAILSRDNITSYLNLFNNMICMFDKYYKKIETVATQERLNSERLLKIHLQINSVYKNIRRFPYIMYTIRPNLNDPGFSKGVFNEELGYFIKYRSEFNQSMWCADIYKRQKVNTLTGKKNTDAFYKSIIRTLSTKENTKCLKCDFCIHPDLSNNGGKYCCRSCKLGEEHGELCQKQAYVVISQPWANPYLGVVPQLITGK